jgi:hypothetical protein
MMVWYDMVWYGMSGMIWYGSLIPDVKGRIKRFAGREIRSHQRTLKSEAKKKRKFTCKTLPYNIWCILIGRGRLE